jgi:hypothetical protein
VDFYSIPIEKMICGCVVLNIKLIIIAAAQELIAMTAANLTLNGSTIPHFRVVLALAPRRLELVLHLVGLVDGILFAIVDVDLVERRLGLVWRRRMMVRAVRLNANDFALASVDFLARYCADGM